MQPFGALTECESFVCFAFVWRVSWRRLHRRGRPSGIYTAFRLLSLTELLSQKQFIYVNDEINSFTMKLNPISVNEIQALERIGISSDATDSSSQYRYSFHLLFIYVHSLRSLTCVPYVHLRRSIHAHALLHRMHSFTFIYIHLRACNCIVALWIWNSSFT